MFPGPLIMTKIAKQTMPHETKADDFQGTQR